MVATLVYCDYASSGTVKTISWLNKQVGGGVGISEITVKAHRGRVMRKMKANSFADLVNMAARLRVALAPKGDVAVPARSAHSKCGVDRLP